MADRINTKLDGSAMKKSVITARKELAKLRKDVREMKNMFIKRFHEIETLVKNVNEDKRAKIDQKKNLRDLEIQTGINSKKEVEADQFMSSIDDELNSTDNFRVIGHIKTCFKEKNGIPRQGSICPLSKAELVIDGVKEFTNPEHALQGLEEFSHVWLLFVFHKNTNNSIKAKVCPPRLNGKKVGVFASRSPHRPSAIGLTLVSLDAIQGNKLLLSGVDILDGTPILDVKPYIPDYDSVHGPTRHTTCGNDSRKEVCVGNSDPKVQTHTLQKGLITEEDVACSSSSTNPLCSKAQQNQIKAQDVCSVSQNTSISGWIRRPPISPLSVKFSETAQKNLQKLYKGSNNEGNEYCNLELLSDSKELEDVITCILQADPRSIHRRNNCPNEIYHFSVDNANVSCLFTENTVAVINVEPNCRN